MVSDAQKRANKKWDEANPKVIRTCWKKYRLKKNYGITIEQYDEMAQKQNHRCAICKKHQSELVQRLSVDHDHITGNIRGLLCAGCNRALGVFRDDPELLMSAIGYLNANR